MPPAAETATTNPTTATAAAAATTAATTTPKQQQPGSLQNQFRRLRKREADTQARRRQQQQRLGHQQDAQQRRSHDAGHHGVGHAVDVGRPQRRTTGVALPQFSVKSEPHSESMQQSDQRRFRAAHDGAPTGATDALRLPLRRQWRRRGRRLFPSPVVRWRANELFPSVRQHRQQVIEFS